MRFLEQLPEAWQEQFKKKVLRPFAKEKMF